MQEQRPAGEQGCAEDDAILEELPHLVRLQLSEAMHMHTRASSNKPFLSLISNRWLGGVWLLVAAGMDGITFFGPLLIRRILDADTTSTGATGAPVQATAAVFLLHIPPELP
jgi:hypothetical protein